MKFLIELFVFLKVRKKWWLIPIVIFSLIFGTVIIISEGSSIAPLIYTIAPLLEPLHQPLLPRPLSRHREFDPVG